MSGLHLTMGGGGLRTNLLPYGPPSTSIDVAELLRECLSFFPAYPKIHDESSGPALRKHLALAIQSRSSHPQADLTRANVTHNAYLMGQAISVYKRVTGSSSSSVSETLE